MKPSLILTTVFLLGAATLFAEFNFQEAINNASSGDTLVIPAGTYTQSVTIDKEITIDGQGAVLTVEANQPAIRVDTSKPACLKNLEIQYQTKTKPQQGEFPYAVYTSGGDLRIDNCTFKGTGSAEASPIAVLATEASTLQIKNSRFDGFNYPIQVWEESKGSVEDCLIINPGHCGITIGGNSTATLRHNIITGSRYHGIRSYVGEINADSNLIIQNRGRGFYIDNKSSNGTLCNNLLINNAAGAIVFFNSKISILNNVILGSSYAGLAIADTADVTVENNIIVANERGIAGFSAEKGETPAIKLHGENIAYGNTTQSEGIRLPSTLIGVDPQFEAPDSGLFTAGASDAKGMGLTNPAEMQALWEKYQSAIGQRAASTLKTKAPISSQTDSDGNAERQRTKARERMRKDLDIYSQDELREIETLYQVANKQWRSEEGKESLKVLISKYDKANRTGSALLYLGQMSQGAERETYLKQAIADFSDCFYGDGVQVGAYARYYLAYYHKEAGEEKKASDLFAEITEKYPNAIDHKGTLLSVQISK